MFLFALGVCVINDCFTASQSTGELTIKPGDVVGVHEILPSGEM